MIASLALASALLAPVSPKDLSFRFERILVGRKGYWESRVAYPRFRSESPVAKFANGDLANVARAGMKEFRKQCKEMLAEERNGRPELPYGHELAPVVSLAHPNLISVYFETYAMTGGAHPSHGFLTRTYGLVGGKAKRLKLQDLFLHGVDGVKAASDLIMPVLKERQAGWVENGDLKAIDAERADNFVLTPAGITFLFEPYSVGSYAEGNYVVKFRYADVAGLDSKGVLQNLVP